MYYQDSPQNRFFFAVNRPIHQESEHFKNVTKTYFEISFNFLPSLPHYNFISSFQTQNAKEQQRLGYAPASSCGVFGRFPWVIYHNGAFQWSQLCSFQFPRYDILLFWITHPLVQHNQNKSHVVFCLPTLKAAIVIRIELIRVYHQLLKHEPKLCKKR